MRYLPCGDSDNHIYITFVSRNTFIIYIFFRLFNDFRRTADVRSVGYSELFSLSREDVLAAMKDYPEAQEILQALGRKRLMEVKASARHPPHHHHHHHHKEHHKEHSGVPKHIADSGKGLVDKIKNEAKVSNYWNRHSNLIIINHLFG